MNITVKIGDNVLISPDLTGLSQWEEGTVIEVEDNTFKGMVITAETKDRNVFFGTEDLFAVKLSNYCKTETAAGKKILDEETKDRIAFITFIIPYFARTYKMSRQNGYLYLEKYGGIDFLFKHWWTLHTEDPFWAARSLYKVCRNNGGLR
jgi:hypothetical protein